MSAVQIPIQQPPKIYLVHAGLISVDPIAETFSSDWPEARVAHLLEDSLSVDFNRDGGLTESMIQRFRKIGDYCAYAGADAILFTCSMFGQAIDAVKRDQKIPVLKPNEAVYDAIMKATGRIVLLSTFEPALRSMMAEIEERMAAEGVRPRIDTHVVAGAVDALYGNRPDEHNRLVAEAVAKFADHDLVAFGQVSMTRALELAQKHTRNPIVTTPHSSVKKLKSLIAV